MVTDNERREVARRLRAHTMNSYINPLCAFEHMVIGKCDGDCTYDLEKDCEENICKRLADLIETSCDRDALLALAEEMENVRSGYTAKAWFTFNARRIREACGVICDD